MGTQNFMYCSAFILVVVTATNANLNKLLSDELVEKCGKNGDNNHGILRCLKNEIKSFCENDVNLTINATRNLNEVGQVFCDMMENGKRNKKFNRKLKRKRNRLIPASVIDNCLDVEAMDGSGDNADGDCIQKGLEVYCGELELNSTESSEDVPFDMPICSCYNQQGRRNMRQCIKDQKKKFCEETENKDTLECKRMKTCGSFGGRQFRACVTKLCKDESNSDNFGCQKVKCATDSNNRRQKWKCLSNLCQNVNYAQESVCLMLKNKTTRKTNRKMLRQVGRKGRHGRPWKRSKNPIPRVVKKMCRDEEAEDKDDCILRKLEDTCKMINETVGTDDNEACKCVGNKDYPETIDGLRLCVKSHMLNYCQDENDDIEKSFDCRKMEECEIGDGGNRFRKKMCIKKLCKERIFVGTCHCKKGRRERRKCFRSFEAYRLESA